MDWPKTDNVLNREGESPLMLAALKGPTSHKSALIKKRRGHQNRLDAWHYARSQQRQLTIISLAAGAECLH
jgi:hypothetical protein